MLQAIAIVLLAAELGAGFASASAELVSTSTNAVEVRLRVEVEHEADSVVAHLTFPGQPELVVPMVLSGERQFTIRIELEPVNFQVVFESLGPDSKTSEPASLMELGLAFPTSEADRTSADATDPGGELGEETERWGWLAVAFGAAALSVLSFWVLGGEDQSSVTDSSDGSEDVEPS